MIRRTAGWTIAAVAALWVLWADVSPAFTPMRSELGDAAGFSRGLLNFVVLAAPREFPRSPAWALLVCAAIVLALAPIAPSSRDDRTARAAAWTAAAAGVFLAAIALAPYLSRYRIVLTSRTFVLVGGLLCAPRVWTACTRLRARSALRAHSSRRVAIVSAAAIGAAFFGSMMVQTLAGYGGRYSGFLHLSRDVAANAPFLAERPALRDTLVVGEAGYDGQFLYLMAFDPFLQRFRASPQDYRRVVDDPPYRYGRIGFSLLTDLLATGEPSRFPATMIWLIVASHFALAALFAWAAVRGGLSPFAGLWYLAIPGFTSSLLSALPESIAAAGLVAGVLCWQDRRPTLAALALGASLFIRETGAVLVVALFVAAWMTRSRREALTLATSLVPIGLWRLFVASRLYADFGWKAIVTNPGDLTVPLAGFAQLWTRTLARTAAQSAAASWLYPLLLVAALAITVVLLFDSRGAFGEPPSRRTDMRPVAWAAVIYGAVAVSLNYDKIWSHIPSGERGTFELFVCLLLLWFGSDDRPVWIRTSLRALFAGLLVYTFAVAPDASAARAALWLIR